MSTTRFLSHQRSRACHPIRESEQSSRRENRTPNRRDISSVHCHYAIRLIKFSITKNFVIVPKNKLVKWGQKSSHPKSSPIILHPHSK